MMMKTLSRFGYKKQFQGIPSETASTMDAFQLRNYFGHLSLSQILRHLSRSLLFPCNRSFYILKIFYASYIDTRVLNANPAKNKTLFSHLLCIKPRNKYLLQSQSYHGVNQITAFVTREPLAGHCHIW